jgi:hypothetical protein
MCVFILSFSAHAQENATSWKEDVTRLEKLKNSGLDDEEQCQTKFDILWTHTKAGNLEALTGLVFYLWGFMHMDNNYMPGHTDMVSVHRDRAIIAVYASAAEKEKDDEEKGYTNYIKGLLSISLSEPPNLDVGDKISKFLECYDGEKQPEKCIDLAVKEHLVPPWNVYVTEIDALIAKGYKPTCNYYHRDHWRNKGGMFEEQTDLIKAK